MELACGVDTHDLRFEQLAHECGFRAVATADHEDLLRVSEPPPKEKGDRLELWIPGLASRLRLPVHLHHKPQIDRTDVGSPSCVVP
jgi:hypothetical protein